MTVVEAPFSIVATPFPRLLYSPFDTYIIMLSVKQGDIKYQFLKVFGMSHHGIKAESPGLYSGVGMAKMRDYDFKVDVFELKLRYYFHNGNNTLGKGINHFITYLY